MRKNYTLLLFSILYFTSFGQYCTTVGPSSTIDSNVESVQLTGASGSINYTGCPGVIGLQDLTSLVTSLNAGSSYTLYVKFGTCGGNFSGAGQVWIDFDQSGTFTPTESIGTWQGIPPVAVSIFNFTVPSGAQNGITRMRVTQQEAGTLPLNPCATFTWGSVMDFGINVGNGIDCTGYTGDDTSDPIVISTLPYTNTGDNSFCYSNQNLVYSSPDVYYQITPSPLMESINVSLCGSSFDTFLTVIDPAGNVIAFNDDAEGCGTQSSLTFQPNGLGLVYVIVEGWGTQSGAYSISINANYLGTDDLDSEIYSIYPNPASEELQLIGIKGEIEIIDLTGNLIKSVEDFNSNSLNISELNPGIYFLRFIKNGQQFSEKFIHN